MNILIGDMLYATCAGEFYGEIIGIGEDANHIPTIDIRVRDADDLIVKDANDEWPDDHGLTRLELPDGVKAILRHVQYKFRDPMDAIDFGEREGYRATGQPIECHTPGDGCYRCTCYFWIYRK